MWVGANGEIIKMYTQMSFQSTSLINLTNPTNLIHLTNLKSTFATQNFTIYAHISGPGMRSFFQASRRMMHTNRLANEKSPYLLQHQHNPVNWYPWGEEAFKQAQTLNRPIFLSIGYSTCHWCHVMERESFEKLTLRQYSKNSVVRKWPK